MTPGNFSIPLRKKHEVEKGLKRYLRQEQYVKEMFAKEKEQEK